MNDLISRQAAIETVMECYDNAELFEVYEDKLRELPPAQPERGAIEQIKWERDVAIEQLKKLGYGLGEKIRAEKDCISRQQAIEEIERWLGYIDDDMVRRMQIGMKRLPPAQPAIVPCNYVEACNVATMDKPISAYTYLSVLADLKDHGFVLVDMREVTE